MAALDKNDLSAVELVLKADADAARTPFVDRAFEPVLCYAIRHRCSVSIIRLLLDHGADPGALNVNGQSSLGVLCATWKDRGYPGDDEETPNSAASRLWDSLQDDLMPPLPNFWGLSTDGLPWLEPLPAVSHKRPQAKFSQGAAIKIALQLINKGADPKKPDGRGKTPFEIAQEAGADHLCDVLCYHSEARNYLALSRVGRGQAGQQAVKPSLQALNPWLVRDICSFLVVPRWEAKLREAAAALAAKV